MREVVQFVQPLSRFLRIKSLKNAIINGKNSNFFKIKHEVTNSHKSIKKNCTKNGKNYIQTAISMI